MVLRYCRRFPARIPRLSARWKGRNRFRFTNRSTSSCRKNSRMISSHL
nr:MAG TPA: hypothetical protein [Bacteriophage sp.]